MSEPGQASDQISESVNLYCTHTCSFLLVVSITDNHSLSIMANLLPPMNICDTIIKMGCIQLPECPYQIKPRFALAIVHFNSDNSENSSCR